MLLTGTFSEYPLPLLLEILQHKEETGLLEISSAEQSGYVFLKKGDVKRCDFGSVSGAKAIELAKSVSNASFTSDRLSLRTMRGWLGRVILVLTRPLRDPMFAFKSRHRFFSFSHI
jgi:hypothetical protein